MSEIKYLGDYACPLWERIGTNKGSFDQSGYEIDHNDNNSRSDVLEDNLQALCKNCYSVKMSLKYNQPDYGLLRQKGTDNKKTGKRPLNEAIGFVYGGLMKTCSLYFFSVDNRNVTEYVWKNLTPYFGPGLCGRFVYCANAREALADLMDQEKKESFDSNILQSSIPNGIRLLKKVCGHKKINFFNTNTYEKKDKCPDNKSKYSYNDAENEPESDPWD